MLCKLQKTQRGVGVYVQTMFEVQLRYTLYYQLIIKCIRLSGLKCNTKIAFNISAFFLCYCQGYRARYILQCFFWALPNTLVRFNQWRIYSPLDMNPMHVIALRMPNIHSNMKWSRQYSRQENCGQYTTSQATSGADRPRMGDHLVTPLAVVLKEVGEPYRATGY